MGLLSKTKDPLDKAKHYIERLKELKNRLDNISNTLDTMREKNMSEFDEYKQLYEKEFEISMILYGIYSDIHKILDYSKTQENEFLVKRLKKEADKIFKPIIIEVK